MQDKAFDRLFVHTDIDGDELDVHHGVPGPGGILVFHSTRKRDAEIATVGLNRAAVEGLRDSLTEWLNRQ